MKEKSEKDDRDEWQKFAVKKTSHTGLLSLI